MITTVGADPNIRFNDGKVDPWGRFVAGTAVIGSTPELGGLYMLDNAGGTARLLSCVTISNGLDWAPDRRSFYYVDTPKQRIDRFNVDPDTGQLLDREVFASIDQRLGLPDGLAVDSEGCLWLAVWGSGAVIGFDPDGREIARIDVPVSCPTSCTFGDSDGKTLFITTARASDDDGSPLAGAVFAVRMTVSGQPVRCFG
ncbi:SMP-30/Gluconolaconase/LRE-like region-containing protein [Novosphingobium mathurense]|uniref:SMP-30/Gluconolaconase/LRE-like region-containing protein n=1 Tax=Novosphingobium mathurense TaxID=428990 RepID=A0A1U6IL93_9SPHN|nr:SMP-30/Gluconolaconase/LRE-like region-containing protein [Novosphingobium mathurense]